MLQVTITLVVSSTSQYNWLSPGSGEVILPCIRYDPDNYTPSYD